MKVPFSSFPTTETWIVGLEEGKKHLWQWPLSSLLELDGALWAKLWFIQRVLKPEVKEWSTPESFITRANVSQSELCFVWYTLHFCCSSPMQEPHCPYTPILILRLGRLLPLGFSKALTDVQTLGQPSLEQEVFRHQRISHVTFGVKVWNGYNYTNNKTNKKGEGYLTKNKLKKA